MGLDITERKLTEKALIESEEKFRLLTSLSPGGIYQTDSHGEFIYTNPAFLNMVGASFDEVKRKSWIDFIHPDDRKKIAESWSKIVDGEGLWKNEFRFQDARGKITWIYGYSTPIIDYKGNTKGYLGLNVPITDRKHQENLVKQKQIELETHSKKLEEMNTALNVLIDHRREEKEGFKKDIIKNFEKLVFPYFPSSKSSKTQEELSTIVSIIERNIKEILIRGSNRNLSLYLGLTPMESQIAHMVKEGRSSKDIAAKLNLSVRTVFFHRENIRKKLNLTKTKTSLKAHLQSPAK
ncbi:PAS domain S-box protein [bacterium]|jgi:PAS domain S-box-containing protein|nr:PAS domain S-box protein [bacterium]